MRQTGQVCSDRQTDRQTAEQIARPPPPCSLLVPSLQRRGSWSVSPSSPVPLVVNWAPARPRPFIASICQSLQAWMVPETLYKWGPSLPFHPSIPLMLSLSPRADRSDPGLHRAVTHQKPLVECGQVVDVLPDTSKVSVPKSHPCTFEELTLWHLHILSPKS